jgi:O-acetyl-ADP-ribose deacetylase (regulator of RNase III)
MSLPLWEDCKWSRIVSNIIQSGDHPFGYSNNLNEKIYLYLGPSYKVPADVLIVSQNESLRDRNGENEAILTLAGPRLEEELQEYAPIQTGESVCTSGGALPVNNIIHAVGPRYDERYITAADHALHSAYKSSLVLAAERGAQDLVISCIYSPRKKYPRWEAAQVALRTTRKFLNHSISNCFQRIMFCVPTQEDFEIYSSLLTAYFPRRYEELVASANLLPTELGDDWGEIRIKERDVNLSIGPKPLDEADHNKYCQKEDVPVVLTFKTGIVIQWLQLLLFDV